VRDRELTVVLRTASLVRLACCSGDLTVGSASRLSRALSKILLDCGRLLVDVDGLALTSTARVALFPALLARAGGWPEARMVLVGSPAAPVARAMRLTGRDKEVPMAVDAAAGLAVLDRRPQRVRRTTTLPTDVQAPGFARELVRVAVADWELTAALRDRAVAVASELVGNAVQHTEGPGELTLTVDESGLGIAVRDGSPTRPARSERSGGLRVVAGLSDARGVTPHPDGKAVWALLRP
jgi:hypothetical protein